MKAILDIAQEGQYKMGNISYIVLQPGEYLDIAQERAISRYYPCALVAGQSYIVLQ